MVLVIFKPASGFLLFWRGFIFVWMVAQVFVLLWLLFFFCGCGEFGPAVGLVFFLVVVAVSV